LSYFQVDRQLKRNEFGEEIGHAGLVGRDELSSDARARHELIFFGSKERKFLASSSSPHDDSAGQRSGGGGFAKNSFFGVAASQS
jgi:hypothetical protein